MMNDNDDQHEESHLIKTEEEKEERCSSCLRFPKSVYFIIITELCERVNYYGMRTILIIYLTQHIQLNEGNAVSIYHLFVSLCYFTTIFSSFLSDNILGKYRTLVIICSVYLFGSVLMSVTSIFVINLPGPLISLLLISLGTGGVKACVGPFGGDQIPPNKKVLLDSFFSMFYFAINLGALFSTILTPILRADVACNGSDDCYPLAFGVPAILMAVALIIFLIGRPYYVQVPIKENVYMKAVECIYVSIKCWHRDKHISPKTKLLDYASSDYDAEFLQDLRTIYRIAILYLPLPIYWALYEQMGSTWTLQATQMDGEIAANVVVLPDQVSILNVVMVMAMIPIFDSCIYPFCYRIKPKLRPLRRMTVGISFTALSFFAAFILQTRIEASQPTKIAPLQSRLVLVNSFPCDVTLDVADGRQLRVGSYQASVPSIDLLAAMHQVKITFKNCKGMANPAGYKDIVSLHEGQINFLIIDADKTGNVYLSILRDYRAPNLKGHPMIRLAVNGNMFDKYQFRLKHSSTTKVERHIEIGYSKSLYDTNWLTVANPGRYLWNVKAPLKRNIKTTTKWLGVLISKNDSLQVEPIKIFSSEVTIFYMTFSDPEKAVVVIPLVVNNGSQISILWQIPQYLLISVGEVLVSITGLSFSYCQAPEGMKSLVNSLWYFSSAIGNIIVMIVAKLHITEYQSLEYLMFGLLCIVFNIVFAGLAFFYRMSQKGDRNRMIEVGVGKDTD